MSDYSTFAVPKPTKRQKAPKPRKRTYTRPDPVDDTLRRAVLVRDRVCFLVSLDELHVCYGKDDRPHPSTDLSKLEVDHVWLDGAHMGDRAPSDLHHLVAMCCKGNTRVGPSREVREAERAYLRSLYPDAHD